MRKTRCRLSSRTRTSIFWLAVRDNIYSSWSRQVINYFKSSMFFTNNLSISVKIELAGVFGVQLMSEHEHCVSPPLFAARKPISSYKHRWNSSLLSNVGREVLIKTSMAASPSFQMGTALFPKATCTEICIMMCIVQTANSSNFEGQILCSIFLCQF